MLKTGIAYHGNRMPRHVEEDMIDCLNHNFNLVVFMFTDTDMLLSRKVMKEMVGIAEGTGLETWIDCWGIGGPPGEKSGFMGHFPESRQVYSNGRPVGDRACFNSRDFRAYIRNWLEAVRETGCKTVFWDEPYLLEEGFSDADIAKGKAEGWTCRCNTCKKLFQERYGNEMPVKLTPEVKDFRNWSMVDYFTEICDFAHTVELKNAICIRPEYGKGISGEELARYAGIKSIDNLGTDPYWSGKMTQPYNYVRKVTETCIGTCSRYGKDHNVWIQGYGFPAGREEEIVAASEAAYDGGARNILAWSYRSGDACDYSAPCPEVVWRTVGDAMGRLKEMYRNECLEMNRRKYVS